MRGAAKSSLRHSLLIPAAIGIVCHINILPNDFCFDDVPIVRDNPKIQHDDRWGEIWTTDYWSNSGQDAAYRDLLYRPVTLSLLRLTRLVAGATPLPFHIVSLILHACCTLLVGLLVRSLLHAANATAATAIWADAAAWVAAAMFAVLPIHSEAVASAVGQADLLATAGTVGALLCHFRIALGVTNREKAVWFFGSALCAFVAMGAKESGICVVPLVFLAELCGLPQAPVRQRPVFLRLIRTAYLLIPLAVYLGLRYHALGGALHQAPALTKTVNVLVDAPAWQRLLGVVQAWGMYWRKTFVPRELAIEYAINSVRLPPSVWQADVIGGIAWLVALAVIAFSGLNKSLRNVPLFLAAGLLISYLPTSNILVLIQVFFAERIWYLPSMFVAALTALIISRLLVKRIWRQVGAILLCVMVVRCWVRNSEWKNNGTLYAATYYDHPASVMARHLYGLWLTQHGDLDRGIDLIHKALEIDLGFTDAHRSLGRAYLRAGQPADALRHLQIAEMQAPGHPGVQRDLSEARSAVALQHQPQLEALRQRIANEPDNFDLHLKYVRLLREAGRTEESLKVLEEAASRFPNEPSIVIERAVTLVLLNRPEDAIPAYRSALELAPRNDQIRIELAMLLLERRKGNDIGDAMAFVDGAIELNPKNAAGHAARAEVFALQGDLAAARESFRRAINLAEPGTPYHRMLQERARALGN